MKRNQTGQLFCLVLIGLWSLISIDCAIVQAREAIVLSLGMIGLLLPAALISKTQRCKALQWLRRAAIIGSSVMHAYLIGMITFLLIFATAHITTGVETKAVVLLGSDLNGNRPGLLYESRINKAQECLEAYPDMIIVPCGGLSGTNTISEAQAAQAALIERGIDPDRIVCEERSTSTVENIRYVAELLEPVGLLDRSKPVAIITNRFHFFRSSQIASAVGYQVLRLIPANGSLLTELPWMLRETMSVPRFWILGPN